MCLKQIGRAALCLVAMAAVCLPGRTAHDDSHQYEAQAKFLSSAPGFAEWPASAFKAANSPLQICVHGDFSFGTSLAELTRTSILNGHRMEVKWARKEQDLAASQILFVSRSAAKHHDKALDAVKNSITLTIGDDADFLQAGGMASLQPAGAGVLFDVNLDAVNEGHLKLSSQLLSLARHVLHHTESGKNLHADQSQHRGNFASAKIADPVLLTSRIGLLLRCGGNLSLELHNAKVKTVQDLRSMADLIGTNEAAALAFQEIQITSLAEDKVPALISGMTRCAVT